MATQITKTIISDISGKEGAATVRIGFDGRTVDIDLTEAETEKVAKFLEPYLEAGRRAIVPVAGRRVKTSSDAAAVRLWARENGFEVGDRGRIPPDVREAYEASR